MPVAYAGRDVRGSHHPAGAEACDRWRRAGALHRRRPRPHRPARDRRRHARAARLRHRGARPGTRTPTAWRSRCSPASTASGASRPTTSARRRPARSSPRSPVSSRSTSSCASAPAGTGARRAGPRDRDVRGHRRHRGVGVRDGRRGPRARRRRPARTRRGGVRRPRARRRPGDRVDASATGSSTCSTCATRTDRSFTDGHAVESLRATLLARLTTEAHPGASAAGCLDLSPDDRSVQPSAVDLLRWAETLSAIARTGLGFTQSLYEKERFEEVLKVAADIRAAAIEEAEAEALFEEWLGTVGEGVAGLRHAEGRGRRHRRQRAR